MGPLRCAIYMHGRLLSTPPLLPSPLLLFSIQDEEPAACQACPGLPRSTARGGGLRFALHAPHEDPPGGGHCRIKQGQVCRCAPSAKAQVQGTGKGEQGQSLLGSLPWYLFLSCPVLAALEARLYVLSTCLLTASRHMSQSKPQQLPGGFASVSTLGDTQTASVVGIYATLGAWSLVQVRRPRRRTEEGDRDLMLRCIRIEIRCGIGLECSGPS